MPSLLQTLKRRRKKLNFVEKLAGIYKSIGWRNIEDRVLCLIQLWADTFMMREDLFPVFMKTYRDLRTEGLKFPPRDPKQRFMIKFEGEPSPAFELAEIEQNLSNVHGHLSVNSLEKNEKQAKNVPYKEKNKKKYCERDEPKFLESDFFDLKEGLRELENILCNAHDFNELQQPRSKEYIKKCRSGQQKLNWVVSFLNKKRNEKSIAEIIEVMEFVDQKMVKFKNAAAILKRGGKNSEIREIFQRNEEKKHDFGDDFLEIGDEDPIDKLQQIMYRKPIQRKLGVEVKTKSQDNLFQNQIKNEGIIQIKTPNLFVGDMATQPNNTLLGSDTSQSFSDLFKSPPQIFNSLGNSFDSAFSELNSNPFFLPNNSEIFLHQKNNFSHSGHTQSLNISQNAPYLTNHTPKPSLDEFEDFFSDLANRKPV